MATKLPVEREALPVRKAFPRMRVQTGSRLLRSFYDVPLCAVW